MRRSTKVRGEGPKTGFPGIGILHSACFLLSAVCTLLPVCLAASSAAAGQMTEARVYVAGRYDLDRLGDLLGELDVVGVDVDRPGGWLTVHATPDQLAEVAALGLRTEVIWANLKDKFYSVTGVDPNDPDGGRDYGYYLNYYEVRDTLQRFARTYPALCSLFSAGPSYQGNEIWCLKISDDPRNEENEPACCLNSTIHADEPLGTSTVVMYAGRLLSGYGCDSVCTWLVNNREIYIIPILNVDGSIYNSDSGGAQSSWRKNRHPYGADVGVDLNRNFGYKWGYDNVGSSPNPSSWNYRGPARLSEPEAQAMRDLSLSHRFRTWADFHMAGFWNLYPWGFDLPSSPEAPVLAASAETLRANNGYPPAQTGQLSRIYYKCNGVMIDWALSDTAGKFPSYSYVFEDGEDMWTYWNDSAGLRRECERNIPNLFYLTRVAGVWLTPSRIVVVDTAQGNGNHELDPGEIAQVWCEVLNQALHPADSAYGITARLTSQYPMVQVTDSLKPMPNVHRLERVQDSLAAFAVQADRTAQPGDTACMVLELRFGDDGRQYTQSVQFKLVIGRATGVDEGRRTPEAMRHTPSATLVRGELQLEPSAVSGRPSAVLLDITGRKVLHLHPGPNDVSRLALGVYFVREAQAQAQAVRKVVITK